MKRAEGMEKDERKPPKSPVPKRPRRNAKGRIEE